MNEYTARQVVIGNRIAIAGYPNEVGYKDFPNYVKQLMLSAGRTIESLQEAPSLFPNAIAYYGFILNAVRPHAAKHTPDKIARAVGGFLIADSHAIYRHWLGRIPLTLDEAVGVGILHYTWTVLKNGNPNLKRIASPIRKGDSGAQIAFSADRWYAAARQEQPLNSAATVTDIRLAPARAAIEAKLKGKLGAHCPVDEIVADWFPDLTKHLNAYEGDPMIGLLQTLDKILFYELAIATLAQTDNLLRSDVMRWVYTLPSTAQVMAMDYDAAKLSASAWHTLNAVRLATADSATITPHATGAPCESTREMIGKPAASATAVAINPEALLTLRLELIKLMSNAGIARSDMAQAFNDATGFPDVATAMQAGRTALELISNIEQWLAIHK